MSDIEQVKPRTCNRCYGTGWHTHGICFGCHGLGIALQSDYGLYKKNVDALIRELGHADEIIQALLNMMTVEQKQLFAANFNIDGAVDSDAVRSHERRAALALFGK